MKCVTLLTVFISASVAIQVPPSWKEIDTDDKLKEVPQDNNARSDNAQQKRWTPIVGSLGSQVANPNQLVLDGNGMYIFPPGNDKVNFNPDISADNKPFNYQPVPPQQPKAAEEIFATYSPIRHRNIYLERSQPVPHPARSTHQDKLQQPPFLQNFLPVFYPENIENKPIGITQTPPVFVTESYRNVLVQSPTETSFPQENHPTIKPSVFVRPKDSRAKSTESRRKSRPSSHSVRPERRYTKVQQPISFPPKETRRDRARKIVPRTEVKENESLSFRNHLKKKYRDDKLHEPENNKDIERDDNEWERKGDDHRIKKIRDRGSPESVESNESAPSIESRESPESFESKESDESKRSIESKESNKSIYSGESKESAESNESKEIEDYDESNESIESQEDDDSSEEERIRRSKEEEANDIPSKPIYPGEGKWAIPGLKHRPHITQHKFHRPSEDIEEKKPDGSDVFEDLEKYFESQKINFGHELRQFSPDDRPKVQSEIPASAADFLALPLTSDIKPVHSPNPIVIYNPFNEFPTLRLGPPEHSTQTVIHPQEIIKEKPTTISSKTKEAHSKDQQEEDEEDDEDDEDEFVPTQLYTQVRKSENEEHLPSDPLESGRLKEVIKDSKVQTVYSEEGYEDLAYDHEGHEKEAEQDEGYSEFEKEKQAKGQLKRQTPSNTKEQDSKTTKEVVDALPADSIYPSAPKATADSQKDATVSSKVKNNNFVTTQELKTTAVKDNADGNIEVQIDSEVQVILQPNNSSKSHKFVKIYPKIIKEIEKEKLGGESKDIVTNKGTSDEIKNRDSNITLDNKHETWDQELLQTNGTEKPIATVTENVEAESLEKIDVQFEKGVLSTSDRKKRSAEFAIDLSFIDKINHTVPTKPPKNSYNTQKYPYYSDPAVNKDSPLRYAEDMGNIPVKIEGRLSFYENAERMKCPEVENIDPVPDRVKNAGKDEPSEEDEDSDEGDEESSEEYPASPRAPRIKLGNKIDCLKNRYFGENPLDSPFFKEELVGPVKPIFKDLDRSASIETQDSASKESAMVENFNEIFKNGKKDGERIHSTRTKDKEYTLLKKQADHIRTSTQEVITSTSTSYPATNTPKQNIVVPTPLPIISLMTTPKYMITLTPKNIYDQITLLEYLPKPLVENAKNTDASAGKSQDAGDTDGANRQSKHLEDQDEESFESDSQVRFKLRRPYFPVFDVNKFIPQQNKINKEVQEETIKSGMVEPTKQDDKTLKELSEASTLKPEPLRRRRIQLKRPYFPIFDINKFITTTPYYIINPQASTVLPKEKVVSEVFYKEEIKPSEQMAVFADVLNNIKSSKQNSVSTKLEKIPLQAASDYAEPSGVTISSVEATPALKVNRPRVKKYQDANTRNAVLTERPFRPSLPDSIRKEHESTEKSSNSKTLNVRTKVKRRRRPTVTTTERSTTVSTTVKPPAIDFIEETETILGLVPPEQSNYNTIVIETPKKIGVTRSPPSKNRKRFEHKITKVPATTEADPSPAPVVEELEEPVVSRFNKYIYLGLRPPPPQKYRGYSDYLSQENLVKRRVRSVRYKREANRPAYSELSRNRGRQEEILEKTVVDDIDDYVPHRPRNYYYDEKTGKIVYLNKPYEKEELEEGDVEVEYIEEEPATHPTPKKPAKATTKPLLATATPPPAGKSFVDFIHKLRSDPSYKLIPDPTTTEKGSAASSTEPTTSATTISTNPPEFLNILAKVRSDTSYKFIEDPKDSKKKQTTMTTESAIEEVVEEQSEESRLESVQNSPGGQNIELSNIQIFDISDYLPKVKNYAPKTAIDYSKYKTIERQKINHKHEEETPQVPSQDAVVSDEQESNNLDNLATTPVPTTTSSIADSEHYETSTPSSTPTVQSKRGKRPTTTVVETTEAETTRTPMRRRQRPQTSRGTRPPPETSRTTEQVERVYPVNDPPKRVYRRRPQRIRLQSESFEEELEGDASARSLRRRSELGSEVAKPSNLEDTLDEPVLRFNNHGEKIVDRDDRSIDEENGNKDNQEVTSQIKSDVVIMKTYDKTRKHGGNYRKAKDDENFEFGNLETRKNDEINKVAAAGSEKNKVLQVEVIKKYDENKKHGGNYKAEDEDDDFEERSYRQTEELNKRNSLDSQTEASISGNSANADRDFSRKRGGNYKQIRKLPIQQSGDYKNEDSGQPLDNVKNQNENRHRLKTARIVVPKKSQVDVFKKYDKKKKHGGNLKSEEDVELEEISDLGEAPTHEIQKSQFSNNGNEYSTTPRALNTRRTRLRTTQSSTRRTGIQRLADVVPKPEHFYNDPQLPEQINQMKDEKILKMINSDEIEEITEGDEIEKADEISERMDNVGDNDESTSAKPLFIKDPSKRLYFYAPV
ncbi:uncharacterized protein LOC132699335 [Cylas formicarius]|uniref:uncharacterized protein LOC132699335 n=1 Tax=Cylas formicarius TaxID=197179 RepID=UPI002958437D|nr:uncharacterized protein LOC132699335 [Cylas formicarius]XP_060521971.1 uncharacterized protein LOC132699335 [Cylas formicarius]XP_060521972.1 uncharacterized protein LOC132699335 [Cylas formicarius]